MSSQAKVINKFEMVEGLYSHDRGSSLTPIEIEKDRVRRQMRQARKALDLRWREAASRQIAQHLVSWPVLSRVAVAHCYLAWYSEVATSGLIEHLLRAGKKVVVPKVDIRHHQLEHYYISALSDVRPGTFGILEPDPATCAPAGLNDLQIILVPGVAFDRKGNRIGSGHGYYDRFLAQTSAPRVGLAFAMQIIDAVPTSVHDQKMDFLVTERDLIACVER